MNIETSELLIEFMINTANEMYSSDVLNKSARRENTEGRMAISVELRKKGYSLQKIGDLFGKNHTTILSGLKQHENLIRFDKNYREKYLQFSLKVNKSSDRAKIIIRNLQNQQDTIIDSLRSLGYDNGGIKAFLDYSFEKSKH